MAAGKKLQGEIDKVFKKVQEGVEIFDETWDKVFGATSANQKDKYESDLKKEIKKLQRLRDQIKTWISSNDLKDKSQLIEMRKLIEQKMEMFKVAEKEAKTKAYSKEALNMDKANPKEAEKMKAKVDIGNWLQVLQDQIAEYEGELEQMQSKKGRKTDVERSEMLERNIERHRFHETKLELMIRGLDSGRINIQQVKDLRDNIEYYVQNSQEPDFMDDEQMYDDLNLDEIDGDGEGSENGSASEKEASDKEAPAPAPAPTPAPAPAPAPAPVPAKAEPKAAAKATPAPAPAAPATGAGRGAQPKDTRGKAAPVVPVPAPVAKPAPAPATRGTAAPVVAAPVSPAKKYEPVAKPPAGAARGTLPVTQPPVAVPVAAPVVAKPAPATKTAPPGPPVAVGRGTTAGRGTVAVPAPAAPAAVVAPPKKEEPKASPTGAPGQTAFAPRPGQGAPASGPQAPIAPISQQPIAPVGPSPVTTPRDSTIAAPGAPIGSGHVPAAPIAAPTAMPAGPQVLTSDVDPRKAKVVSPHEEAMTEERFATVLAALENSFGNIPDQTDSERPKQYTPRTPVATPAHYPKQPHNIFENPSVFEKFEAETLFFIFYYQQGTYQQYLAARELKKQSWRYHKNYLTWFQRHEEPKVITDDYEHGTYVYFDYETGWCQRKKTEFTFEYRFLEDEPL